MTPFEITLLLLAFVSTLGWIWTEHLVDQLRHIIEMQDVAIEQWMAQAEGRKPRWNDK